MIEDAALDITYKFWYQLISAFQTSFNIVLAFQTNDIIKKLIGGEEVQKSYAIVIPVLILLSIFSSYLKERYVQTYGKFVMTSTGLPKGSSHSFYH